MLETDDHDTLTRNHPEVLLFDELFRQYREYDLNRLQLMRHANCDHFISVLGLNAVIAPYFAGINVVYAAKGHEAEHTTDCGKLYRDFAMRSEQAIVYRVRAYSELLDHVRQHYPPEDAIMMHRQCLGMQLKSVSPVQRKL